MTALDRNDLNKVRANAYGFFVAQQMYSGLFSIFPALLMLVGSLWVPGMFLPMVIVWSACMLIVTVSWIAKKLLLKAQYKVNNTRPYYDAFKIPKLEPSVAEAALESFKASKDLLTKEDWAFLEYSYDPNSKDPFGRKEEDSIKTQMKDRQRRDHKSGIYWYSYVPEYNQFGYMTGYERVS